MQPRIGGLSGFVHSQLPVGFAIPCQRAVARLFNKAKPQGASMTRRESQVRPIEAKKCCSDIFKTLSSFVYIRKEIAAMYDIDMIEPN
jgi:hypothetical protein